MRRINGIATENGERMLSGHWPIPEASPWQHNQTSRPSAMRAARLPPGRNQQSRAIRVAEETRDDAARKERMRQWQEVMQKKLRLERAAPGL